MIAQFKKNSYQWSPLAVILIMILACVSLPDAKREKASANSTIKTARQTTLRQVWAGPDVDFMGAPSPDGRYISYPDWDTGDLAIYEIATGKKRRLTNKGSWDESGESVLFSRWSPDGKQIVYDWFNEKGFSELRIVGLDGSKPRILCSNEEGVSAQTYDWSADGKQILSFFSGKAGSEIVLVSVADGSVRVLKTLDIHHPYDLNMKFSPDGSYIVYNFPQGDISLLSTDGSREIPLIEHPANDRVLGWAPDGKHIVFTSNRTGSKSAWLIGVADGKPHGAPELVKLDIGEVFIPMGFTQKGSFYYGERAKGVDNIHIAQLDPDTGKVLAPSKKAIKRFEGTYPDYSPDGKYLAYTRRGNVLCIYSLETGQKRELSTKLNAIEQPSWSPDGSSVLVGGWDFKKGIGPGIYQIHTQTGTVKPLVPPPEDGRLYTHEWSRDGKAFFLVRHCKTGDVSFSQIILREIKSGKEKELYRASKHVEFCLSCSPDGKQLAFVKEEKGILRVIATAGGEPRELYRCEQEDRVRSLRWTADGKYILFAIWRPEQKRRGLWRISIDGGEPEKLGLEMSLISFLSVHPDGQHIAFQSSVKYKDKEVWVMENFLPEVSVAKPAHQPKFRKIQIATKPGNGVLSPDGKKLAFVSKGSIWIVPVHGKVSPDIAGEPVRLPGTQGAWRWGMSWSADGKWIAYNNLENDEICVVPSSGGRVKRISMNKNRGTHLWNYRLSLSPDGKIVAFAAIEKEKIQLFAVNVEGADVNQLTEDGGTQPAFSPDGKKITYVKERPQKRETPESDVWVISASGSTPVQVSDLPGRAIAPIWSPDGKMIAFTRTAEIDESKEICIVPVSEAGNPEASPTQIELPLVTWDFLAGWTPDNKIGVLLTEPRHQAIYTVPASGGNATQVTPQGNTFHPRWSPDAERIYFRWNGGDIASVPSEGGEISISPIDADSKIFVALPGAGNAVSPDGKKIVFSGAKTVFRDNKKTYEVDIHTVPIEGGEPKKLTISPGQDRFPCWSPDGKSIAFIRHSENPEKKNYIANICIVPTEGREVMQLTSEPDKVAWSTIAWSPDGKSIAYFSDDKAIKVIPVQGGESSEVVKVEDVSSHSELTWSPDGTKLVYSSKGSIWVIASDGGQPEEIETGLDAKACHVSWSPDGRKIAFSATRGGDAELWLIENFLPEIEPTGKVVRQVCEGSEWWKGCSISPLGKFFAFSDRKDGYGEASLYDLSSGMFDGLPTMQIRQKELTNAWFLQTESKSRIVGLKIAIDH